MPYIRDKNTVTAYINNQPIDLPHLAATTLGYLSSPLVPDFWTGWDGDLATAMADVTRENKNNNNGRTTQFHRICF